MPMGALKLRTGVKANPLAFRRSPREGQGGPQERHAVWGCSGVLLGQLLRLLLLLSMHRDMGLVGVSRSAPIANPILCRGHHQMHTPRASGERREKEKKGKKKKKT